MFEVSRALYGESHVVRRYELHGGPREFHLEVDAVVMDAPCPTWVFAHG